MTTVPRVSVVIPLYNYGHFLAECVASVADQDGVAIDVLIVDDASTDDSLAVARRIAETETRVAIRVEANPRNLGMIETINRALWGVDGTYVVKLDADDLLTPGSLARSVALLEANPTVAFVYGFPRQFNESPPPPAETRVRSWSVWPGEEWVRLMCRRGVNTIMQPEVVMRTAALLEAGTYEPELPHGSDFEMWLRLAMVGDVGRVNGPDQGYYRVHDQSMQRTVNAGYLKDLEGRRDTFQHFFDKAGHRLPDAEALHAQALHRVAVDAVAMACEVYDEGRSGEPVDAYVAVAEEVCPEVTSTRTWRGYERRVAAGPASVPRSARAFVSRTARDLDHRRRWRRWRRTGV